MKKILMSAVALTAIMGTANVATASEDGLNIFNNAKFSGEIRPRFEYANKEEGAEGASAFTARTRLAIATDSLAEVDGLNAKIGVTTVNNFGYTNYKDGAGQGNEYELILDPQQAMLSEAFLTYTKADTTLLAGRSHVNLDDQRFIGTVGWRQMERAYDTVTVINKSIEGLTVLGSYVYGFQGVSAAPTADTASVLLNVNYKVSDAIVVSGFSYMLANIHDTYGLRVTGKAPVGDIKLNYAVSYAMQADNTMQYGSADITNKIEAAYYDISIGANIDGIIVGAEYEVLGEATGDSTKGFTTPLATLHKFQGFADEFLGQTAASNNNGLGDMNIKAGYKAKGFGKAIVWFHKFDAQTGSNTDLGSEIDAVYANKVPGVKGLNGLLKAAYFMGGEAGSGHDLDNAKIWAQLDYKF